MPRSSPGLLTAAGVEVLYHTTVDDDAARLEKAVTIARGRAELLVFTGGLGPTYDDMTKTAVCAALDTPLVLHQEVVADIRRYFDTVFRREMPECDMQQAYLPEGCTVFRNPVGTAPAACSPPERPRRCCCPACPTSAAIWPSTACCPGWSSPGTDGAVTHAADLRPDGAAGAGAAGRPAAAGGGHDAGTLCQAGEVMLQLSARGGQRACEARMAPVLAEVRGRLGALSLRRGRVRAGGDGTDAVPGTGTDAVGGGELYRRPHRQALTDLPGASQVFLGGVVSYTNHVKQHVLHVPENLLARCGAVSAEVARAMALGVRVLTGATWPCPSPDWPVPTGTTGETRWAPCSWGFPRRRA